MSYFLNIPYSQFRCRFTQHIGAVRAGGKTNHSVGCLRYTCRLGCRDALWGGRGERKVGDQPREDSLPKGAQLVVSNRRNVRIWLVLAKSAQPATC
jgi:hypothetical protein